MISTPLMLKGHESDHVTVQRWKPKHLERYKNGSLRARRQLYVAITRSMDRLIIHEEMMRLIQDHGNP